MAMQAFRRTFRLNDFTLNEGPTANEADLIEGQWQTAYFYDLGRGEARILGRGEDSTPDNAEGRIYVRFDDADGTQILPAQVRFSVRTLQGELVRIIADYDLEELDAGLSDRSDRFPFPVQERQANGSPVAVGRDRRLAIDLKPAVGSGHTEVDDGDSDTEVRIDGFAMEDVG